MKASRRKILKTLGIAAGISATGLLPGTLMAGSARPALDKSRILGKKGLDAILIGAGSRGARISAFSAGSPQALRVIAVAEPVADRNRAVADQHGLRESHCFSDWKAVFQHPKFADVVLVTASGNYLEVCTAALEAGYDVWVDRPVSVSDTEKSRINALAKKHGRQLLFFYGYPKNLCFMEHTLFSASV